MSANGERTLIHPHFVKGLRTVDQIDPKEMILRWRSLMCTARQ
jgi:kynurenine formamidase